MKEHKEQAAALIDAGLRDALSLQLLNQSGRAPHESIGFHAQQACEKFIKARLVLNGIVFERTHDLVALCKLASQNKIVIPVDVETLRALNGYAVQFRYEGCAIELVPSANCEVVTLHLSAWVKEAFDLT